MPKIRSCARCHFLLLKVYAVAPWTLTSSRGCPEFRGNLRFAYSRQPWLPPPTGPELTCVPSISDMMVSPCAEGGKRNVMATFCGAELLRPVSEPHEEARALGRDRIGDLGQDGSARIQDAFDMGTGSVRSCTVRQLAAALIIAPTAV